MTYVKKYTYVKRSTYQKVVEQNKKLINDIRIMVGKSTMLTPAKIKVMDKHRNEFKKESDFLKALKKAITKETK